MKALAKFPEFAIIKVFSIIKFSPIVYRATRKVNRDNLMNK